MARRIPSVWVFTFLCSAFPLIPGGQPCYADLRNISVTASSNPSAWNESQRVNNPFFNRIPAPFVVLPRDVHDVQRALQCAHENNLRVSIKAGGHGFGGYSAVGSNPTAAFALAFPNMTALALDEQALTMTVQAGVRWGDVYRALDNTNLVAVGGLCPSVGVAGYVQGGGVGAMSRRHGLALDNVLGFQMVTANGSDVVTVNATSTPDLFFALRGSGGGNFGVITEITLRLHVAPPSFTFSLLCYPFNATGGVYAAVAGMAGSGMPTDANVDVVVSPPDGAGFDGNVCAWGIVHGNITYSNATLAPLLPPYLSPLPPSADGSGSFIASYPAFEPMITQYGILHGYSEFSDEGYANKNCLLSNASLRVNGTAIAALVAATAAVTPSVCSLHWIQFGGAMAAVAPNATAFPWRSAAYMYQAICSFTNASTYTISNAFLNDFWTSIAPYCGDNAASTGAYVNFIDPFDTAVGWEHKYYGDNVDALRVIKQTWAPYGSTPLRFAQEIAPAAVVDSGHA